MVKELLKLPILHLDRAAATLANKKDACMGVIGMPEGDEQVFAFNIGNEAVRRQEFKRSVNGRSGDSTACSPLHLS